MDSPKEILMRNEIFPLRTPNPMDQELYKPSEIDCRQLG